MYEKVSSLLGRAVRRVLPGSGLEEDMPPIHLMRPPSDAMGDYASNIALVLADRLKRKPSDIARDIAAHVEDSEGILEGDVSIAGRGFLNFKVKMDRWFDLVSRVRDQGESFFMETGRGGRKILVEFVSANPTGPLHVGHGRGAVIGDALVKVLRAAGHDAASEYYVNDRGRQVYNLGLSVQFRYNRLFDETVPEPEGENWYRGAYVQDMAEKLRGERGDSLRREPPGSPLFKDYGVAVMQDRLKEDLASLGILFDVWFHESRITEEMLRGTIEELRRRGHVRVHEDGSVAFLAASAEAAGSEEGDDEEERILVKRTGDYTYFATDIPYHVDKIGRGFEQLINVWGADHHGYIPRVKASLKALGHDPDMLKVVLVQMVSLSRGGEPVKMSKRAGEFVTLREIVDEVGRDAFRFIFLTRRADSQFEFDIEAAKKRNLENPVFHVQYGHARLCSILRRARERLGAGIGDVTGLETLRLLGTKLARDDERRILKDALRLREVIGDAARTLQPHRLATFAMDISKELQSYYTVSWRVDRDPVLPPESMLGSESRFPDGWDEDKTRARLLWMDAVRISLKTALGILGVTAPERMEKIEDGDVEEE
jgi:arginyl-tRNA synthetase